MTFANVGTLDATPGHRDELAAILMRRSHDLEAAGCLLYEVGVSDDALDTVFVVELWESAAAHAASLQLDSVRSAIAEAMPLLSGTMGGFRFDVVGSPLRDAVAPGTVAPDGVAPGGAASAVPTQTDAEPTRTEPGPTQTEAAP